MKHLRGSTQATIHPWAIILTVALWALVSMIAQRSIVTLILPPLCFLRYYHIQIKYSAQFHSIQTTLSIL